MLENLNQNTNENLLSETPQSGAGAPLPSSNNFISLSEASKQTGYHQVYLGFLCRQGKLKGFKIGRNWVTTKDALDEFLKGFKNGLTQVIDESGNKIKVRVENNFNSSIPSEPALAGESGNLSQEQIPTLP